MKFIETKHRCTGEYLLVNVEEILTVVKEGLYAKIVYRNNIGYDQLLESYDEVVMKISDALHEDM